MGLIAEAFPHMKTFKEKFSKPASQTEGEALFEFCPTFTHYCDADGQRQEIGGSLLATTNLGAG